MLLNWGPLNYAPKILPLHFNQSAAFFDQDRLLGSTMTLKPYIRVHFMGFEKYIDGSLSVVRINCSLVIPINRQMQSTAILMFILILSLYCKNEGDIK